MAEEALYQLEVKLPSGENGESRTQVINIKGAAQIWYSNREEFPEQGNTLMLYVAVDEALAYIWDSVDKNYVVLGGKDEVMERIEEIDRKKVDFEVYAVHSHSFTPQGVIKEEVVESVEVTETTVNEVETVGTLPQWGYSYNNGTLSFSWVDGNLPTAKSKTVVGSVTSNKVIPTFEGVEGVSGFADNTAVKKVVNGVVDSALDKSY